MAVDHIIDAVMEYLENGGELPPGIVADPDTQFLFITALLKATYEKSCDANNSSELALSEVSRLDSNFNAYKLVIDARVDALVDKVNVRLGLIGGIIILANVILFALTKVL